MISDVPVGFMRNQKQTVPKVCVLTQTASDLPPYYREFFDGLDLFFVTFKQKNSEAVDFLPASTWSDGRNRLWEYVKGRYDYYLFIDDDLEFFCRPTDLPVFTERILKMKPAAQKRLRLHQLTTRFLSAITLAKADSGRFRKLLFRNLMTYSPMVASLSRLAEAHIAAELDIHALSRNRLARPMGWFDAQATIFSEVGARLLLPYDTDVSGWWSSQIPIYCLGHLAFKGRAINFLDIATRNASHEIYRPGYDGIRDCLTMSAWLSHGILDPGCDPLDLEDGSFIDFGFGSGFAKTKVKPAGTDGDSVKAALLSLQHSFDLHHPYIYDRHERIVDEIDVEASSKPRENVYG